MERPDTSARRSGLAVDASAWREELRQTVLPALIDKDAVWISLVESGAAVREADSADGAVTLDLLEAARPESWRRHLGAPPRTVIVDLLSLRASTRYAAPLLGAAREANPGGTVALIAAVAQLNSYHSSVQLRSLLVNEFSIEWIVWCDSKQSPLSLVIVVVRARPTADAVTRLVDGRRAELVEVAGLIESCGRRAGGRDDRVAVYRGPLSTEQPWTWWEFSPEAAAEREDVRAFGDARPLDEIAGIMSRPGRRFTITEIEDGQLAVDHVGLVSGAQIGLDGELGFPLQQVPRAEINDQDLLCEGDCVVSTVTRRHLRIASVPAGGPPLTHHSTIVVVRFRSSIGAIERSVILAYLRSGRFARGIASVNSTIGDHLRVTPRSLCEAIVPRFSDAFLEAWQRARDARQQLRAWADEVDDASFFEASSMRAELPAFLERSRAIRNRVAAAAELDTIEGRIRQRYPHPLAVRYEDASQMEHGAERIRETLACAEHLVLFLAFLGVVNLGTGRVASLAAWTDDRGLRLDWGKADTLLREAVAKAAHERDRLQLPIPELATMHDIFAEPRSALNQACSELRRWRNDESHLVRGLAGEVVETSERLAEHLRVLFEAAALLTQTPLLAVEDYKRDPHSEEPRVRFAYVVGASAAFQRQWERVEGELIREHLVVRDVHGKHHSLHPWLIRRTCYECHQAETFVLSGFDQDHARYVAMESGHVLSDPALSQALANLVRASSR